MFYGWKLVLIGAFCNFILQGCASYMMNAFMEPLTVLHGWSRLHINLAMGAASLCGSISTPIVASLASQYSLRYMVTLGAFFGGVAFVLLGHTQEIWLFALLLSIVWIAGQACGGVGINILMGNWFSRYRAKVFGLVSIGTSLSGAILPFVALFLVEKIGVKWAYTSIGSVVLLFTPICYYMIRDTPAALGLGIDGDSPSLSKTKKIAEPSLANMTTRELLRSPAIWIIGCAMGMLFMAMAAVVSQLKPHFVDVGFNSYKAMLWVSVAALSASVGKYMWGWICGILSPLKTLKLILLCNALSLSLIFLPQNDATVLSFAILYGASYGGGWVILPVTIQYVFGEGNFLHAYQIVLAFLIVKAFGYPIIGYSYSLTGGYEMGYIFFVILLFCAFFLSLFLKEESAVEYHAR